MKINVKKVGNHELPVPSRATEGAAGFDLQACIQHPVVIPVGEHRHFQVGWIFEIPSGFEGQCRARSGLAKKHGLALSNGVGTIDSDYRGEMSVMLVNHGDEPFVVTQGMRIAQLVIQAVPSVELEVVETLSDTARGANGFGSTGLN